MTATQTSIRHGTAAQCDAGTPASSELLHDSTNHRIRIGDGAVLGGAAVLPNIRDIQTNATQYAAAGGTGDALTLAITPVPAAWTTALGGKFKATAPNTGAATATITGLAGTKTIKKIVNGALADLDADDFFNGGFYDWIYDGTYLLIISTLNHGGGLLSVSQGDLNTSTGIVSKGTSTSRGHFTLPGGQYGFYPQIRREIAGTGHEVRFDETTVSLGTTYVTNIALYTGNAVNLYAQQRYITSSPPFDLGDGEVGGFFFVLVNPAGDIVGTYSADVPPWAYNGPTDIRAVKKDPITKKKYRRVMVARTLEEIMDGAKITHEYQEITQAIKNADMPLIPHPFGAIPPGHSVVLLDPMDQRIRDLIDYQNIGGANEISDAISTGKIRVDNTPLTNRKGPPGVMQARMSFKYTRG